MKKRIAILTAARAEYGLLSPVIKKLLKDERIDVRVVVTGMHLSPEFGLTYKEIEKDNIRIDRKIEILMGSDTPVSMSKTMGMAMLGFADYFDEMNPDALLVLGDRYESLAVCCTAMNARIPIIHLHGGETTEGAIDEAVRHSITKMSFLHLTSTEEYRDRVIQMGENPGRVYNVGALGVENVLQVSTLSKAELEKELGIALDRPYTVITFHPVTLEQEGISKAIRELFTALDCYSNMIHIITKANADAGGRQINDLLERYAGQRENVYLFDSLGLVRYLSAVRHSEMVLGNSSSGILEVPSFGIPTVNIGDRQKGRIRAESVIDCDAEQKSIVRAIELADSDKFKEFCRTVRNPYEGLCTSEKIVELIKEKVLFTDIDLKKRFFDIAWRK